MDHRLGLHEPPTTVFLFVGEGEDGESDYNWYRLDGNNNRIPVHEKALTGWIQKLQVCMKKYKNEEKPKVDIYVRGDRPYVIRSGIESNFTRGILLALETLADRDLGLQAVHPLTIVAADGEEKKVVFGHVYLQTPEGAKKVKHDWDKEKRLWPLIVALQAKLGQTPQTWTEVQASLNGRNGR